MASLAIVMSYFSVGVALELLYTPIAYYLIDNLGAESGVYTVWYILFTLPWSFKVHTNITSSTLAAVKMRARRCYDRPLLHPCCPFFFPRNDTSF